jgi:hypothetical protein
MLDAAEEPLDQVPIFVEMFVKRPLHQSIAARRYDGLDARRAQMLNDGITVVSLVSAERSGA